MTNLIDRPIYLKKISPYFWMPLIKVITGMRRVWKTYFLRSIMSHLEKNHGIDKKQIIYIDKENEKFDKILDYMQLSEYIKKEAKKIQAKKILCIDEIQDIEWREKCIKNYASKDDFDIYITWSNSTLLSSELSTYITWRYIEIHILPLTFQEFLLFRWNKKGDIKQEFNLYLKMWWLPLIHHMELKKEVVYPYLKGVFSTILFKDIIKKQKIRNANLLFDIFTLLCDTTGSIVSTKKIVDYLKKEKISLSLDTLREYLFYLQEAYLVYKTPRFDIKWKRRLELYEKYFVGDIGINNAISWFKNHKLWQLLENIVYLELLARWYEVKIGKVWLLEVDFVAEKQGSVEYYQVCYLLNSESTKKREFGVFDHIDDNYPKFVLSLDDFFPEDYNGIKRINLMDWLINSLSMS